MKSEQEELRLLLRSRFPLIVVLHGGYGREVTDGNIMVDVAQYLLGSQNGLLTEANRAAFPAYIVLPVIPPSAKNNSDSRRLPTVAGIAVFV